MKRRIVVGISGASGAVLGIRILELLAAIDDVETHLVVSGIAEQTITHEIGSEGLGHARSLAAGLAADPVRHRPLSLGQPGGAGR